MAQIPLTRIALWIRAQSKALTNIDDQLRNSFELLTCTK